MDSPISRKSDREELLNESWVDLHFASLPPQPSAGTGGCIERLLDEAQRESRTSSVYSASQAPSRHSPIELNFNGDHHQQQQQQLPLPQPDGSQPVVFTSTPPVALDQKVADWIWDWSSRPESLPPADYSSRLRHPRRYTLSVRRTRLMKSGLLPTLILTHACSFLLGAALVFICYRKFATSAKA